MMMSLRSSCGFVLGTALFLSLLAAPAPGQPAPQQSGSGIGAPLEEGLIRLQPELPSHPTVPAAADLRIETGDVPQPLPDPAARAAGIEALKSGIELAALGRRVEAVAAFTRAGSLLPHMEDWALVLSARAHVAPADTGEVRRLLAPVVGSRAGEWAWRIHYDALLEAGDTAAAIHLADRHADVAVTAAERAVALARAGGLRIARQDRGGLEYLRSAMRESLGSAGGLAAARAAHDLPDLGPEDRLLVGRTLLAHGGIDRAVPMLEAYAAATSEAAPRAAALLDAGRALFNARRYEHASRVLRSAAEHEPEGAFLLARSLYREGRQEQGTNAFQEVVRRYSSSVSAADALFLLGDLAHDDGRPDLAGEYYRQAIASGAHGTSATDAAVRLAGMSLLKGDGARALVDLQEFFRARPRDRTAVPALYWLGRAHLAAADEPNARTAFREALELDPFSYYGMLAAERLGSTIAELPLPDPPDLEPESARQVEYGLSRVDILREIGLPMEADLELSRLRDEFAEYPPALYPVAEYLLGGSAPMSGALLARDIERATGSWDDRLLRIVYPFPHREIIMTEAERRGLIPFEVAGLIRQESFFNPNAVSAAGAIGLMQVMPQTGAGLARRTGINGFNSSMLRDPSINMRLGSLYLADQMDRWNGRLSDVLSAYNAGPNRVARWRTFPEHADDEIYIERIPIAETRDYVKRVKLNAAIYRRLYEGAAR